VYTSKGDPSTVSASADRRRRGIFPIVMARERARIAFRSCVAAAALAAHGASAAPRDVAGFGPGEQIDFQIEFLHVRAGHARMTVGRPEGSVWPLVCQARTDGVATILDVREHYVSYWDADAGETRGADLDALEVGDAHQDRARFRRAEGKVSTELTRKGRTRRAERDAPPDVHDVASALLQLRLRPLEPGARVEYPVFFGTKTYTLRAEVEGRERVETPLGAFDALRVRVDVAFEGKFRTTHPSHVWFSTDARRLPVKFVADFALGSVAAKLSGYVPGERLGAR
jgi:hypothetical protein